VTHAQAMMTEMSLIEIELRKNVIKNSAKSMVIPAQDTMDAVMMIKK